jgi:type IV pilus assembly protein PilB
MAETRRFLGEIMMDMGCVTQEDIDRALEIQMKGDARKIGEIFAAEGLCTATDITAALAEQFGMEMVDLQGLEITQQVAQMVSEQLCRDNHVMPVDMFDGVLTLAISDPLDLHALDNIRFMTNCQVEPVLATREAIDEAINKWYTNPDDYKAKISDLTGSDIEYVNVEQMAKKASEDDDADTAPVIKLVHLLIQEAVKNRASDIHIEPMMERLRVRDRKSVV